MTHLNRVPKFNFIKIHKGFTLYSKKKSKNRIRKMDKGCCFNLISQCFDETTFEMLFT